MLLFIVTHQCDRHDEPPFQTNDTIANLNQLVKKYQETTIDDGKQLSLSLIFSCTQPFQLPS